MENKDVARILRETAQLLEIDGASIGRYRTYEKVAELLYSIPDRIEELAKDDEKLRALPGVGEGMAAHIREVLATGDYELRAKLLKKFPITLLDLMNLQSLGPKKVAFLWSTFQCATVADLEKLAKEGKLRDLPGFGEKSEENILKATALAKKSSGRFLLSMADEEARKLSAYIHKHGNSVESVTPAGSLRRGRETVGDLDLLVTMKPGQDKQKHIDALTDHILKYPGIDQQLARGENKVSFVLGNTLQVDVRMLAKESFGAALLYFSGSKEHNVVLRGRARDMGWTLNEYALTTLEGGKHVAGATEQEIYDNLQLDYIEPELRENTGEIASAEKRTLPKLVTLADIRGDLQMHTTASDGRNTIEEMGRAAQELGYGYIALTDHSKAVTVANGMDEKRTLEQIKKIRDAQKRVPGIRLLAGIEVDILKNGTLDLDNEVLAQLDVVVASIHSYMNMEYAEMTDRILAAIENPYTQIIAHPTGRLVLRRDAFDYNMERILDAAKKAGVAMECNAYPDRLDLKDVHLRMAKDRGVKVVISTDAHTTTNLKYMKYGVITARRAWLTKENVINTLPVDAFLAALRPKPDAVPAKSAPAATATVATKTKAAKAGAGAKSKSAAFDFDAEEKVPTPPKKKKK
jgi:DNA polymerase (family 10)